MDARNARKPPEKRFRIEEPLVTREASASPAVSVLVKSEVGGASGAIGTEDENMGLADPVGQPSTAVGDKPMGKMLAGCGGGDATEDEFVAEHHRLLIEVHGEEFQGPLLWSQIQDKQEFFTYEQTVSFTRNVYATMSDKWEELN